MTPRELATVERYFSALEAIARATGVERLPRESIEDWAMRATDAERARLLAELGAAKRARLLARRESAWLRTKLSQIGAVVRRYRSAP